MLACTDATPARVSATLPSDCFTRAVFSRPALTRCCVSSRIAVCCLRLSLATSSSAYHGNRERQACRRVVGIRGLYARACRGQQGAVAAPEVEVETEVERHTSVG